MTSKTTSNWVSIIVLILILFINNEVVAQFTINAGTDTTFCVNIMNNDTFKLDNLKLINGTSPYNISWHADIDIGLIKKFTASDFLNDTTSIKPYFINHITSPQWLTLFVTIKDANGNFAKDSINVRFSNFSYPLGYIVDYVRHGDSIQIFHMGIGGGIRPLQYFWESSKWLSFYGDDIWCKPDSSFKYREFVIDSVGCKSEPNLAYEINIQPLSSNNYSEESFNLRQIGNKIFFNNIENDKIEIVQLCFDGKIVNRVITKGNEYQLKKDLIHSVCIVKLIKNNITTCYKLKN